MRFDEDAQILPNGGPLLARAGFGAVVEELVECLAVKSGELTVMQARMAHADAAIALLARQVVALEDLNANLAEELDELQAELAETDAVLLAATLNVDRTLQVLADLRSEPEPVELRLVS